MRRVKPKWLFQESENHGRKSVGEAISINARSAHKTEQKPWASAHGSLLLTGVLVLGLGSAAFFVYHTFLKQPPLEEKFVVEKENTAFESRLPSTASANPIPAKPSVAINQSGESGLLPATKVFYQTFNNCGPANLSMILSFYGIKKSQEELADELRPYRNQKGDNDDKTVFPEEFVRVAKENGLEALSRPNGSIQLVKLLIANDIPVVVKTLFRLTEDSAHYRIIRGFNEEKQIIITDDSYYGPNKKISYFDFLTMWQPFNYVYIAVYPPEKQEIVETILGEQWNEEIAYQHAAQRAQKEIEKDPENIWPKFNLVNSYYHIGKYQESVAEFEKIESKLPRRALWYQIEPILAYQKLGNYDRVFQIVERVLSNDNRAFSELYQIRGEIYLEKGDKEAARQEFEQAFQYNKNYQPAKEALQKL